MSMVIDGNLEPVKVLPEHFAEATTALLEDAAQALAYYVDLTDPPDVDWARDRLSRARDVLDNAEVVLAGSTTANTSGTLGRPYRLLAYAPTQLAVRRLEGVLLAMRGQRNLMGWALAEARAATQEAWWAVASAVRVDPQSKEASE